MEFIGGLLVGTFLGVSIMCLMQVKRVNENAMWIELGKAIEWGMEKYWPCKIDIFCDEYYLELLNDGTWKPLLDAYSDRELQQ